MTARPVLIASVRYPSHFTSYDHPGPVGRVSAEVASIGRGITDQRSRWTNLGRPREPSRPCGGLLSRKMGRLPADKNQNARE